MVVVLAIEGMMCQNNCGSTVRQALTSVPGVLRAEVSFAENHARVWTGDGSSTGGDPALLESIVRAVENVGFGATVLPDMVLEVEGMMCQRNCGTTVQAALAAVAGVHRAEVSFADRRALVWLHGGTEDALVAAVEGVGFGAEVAPAVVLAVGGMMCQKNCGTTVRQALEAVPCVSRAEVSFAQKRARVWGGGGSKGVALRSADLVDAIETIGFEAAEAPAVELDVSGMMCQNSCGTTVRQALENVAGVSRAEVSFAKKRARVWGSSGRGVLLSTGTLVDAVVTVGFDASGAAAPGPSPTPPPPAGVNGRVPAKKQPQQQLRRSSVTGRELNTESRGSKNGRRSASAVVISSNGGAKEGRSGDVRGGGGQLALSTGSFTVEGMSCAACVGKVERFVGAMRGVGEVRVALLAGQQAEVKYDTEQLAPEDIARGVSGLGYKCQHLRTVRTSKAGGGGGAGRPNTLEVEVTGMSCTSCSGKVERAVLGLPGVASCSVSVTTGRASVTFKGDGSGGKPSSMEEGTEKEASGVRDVIRAVEGLGFGAKAVDLGGDALSGVKRLQEMTRKDVAMWRRLFLLSVFFTVPLLLAHWLQVLMLWEGPPVVGGISLCDFVMFVLATPVQFVVGRRFYRAAWMGIKHGSLGMDALVVMGTSSAYLFSVCVLLVKCSFDPEFPSKCTFETAAMLLTLVSLGKLMEAIAKGQTSSSLTALVKLQPRTALLLPPPGVSVGTEVAGSLNGHGGTVAKKKRRGNKMEMEYKEIDAGLVQVKD
ncbi:unnamed protein product, partial [Ectocarpus sp. 13 AM-2016]